MTDNEIDKQTNEETIQEYGQAFGVKTEKEGWYGNELQTKPTLMVDPGTGKALILRTFEFAKNPEFKTKAITKQELFNMHWRQIRVMLWGYGLVPNEDAEPRIVIDKDKYRIFILCQPKLNTFVADKLKTLQDIFKKK